MAGRADPYALAPARLPRAGRYKPSGAAAAALIIGPRAVCLSTTSYWSVSNGCLAFMSKNLSFRYAVTAP
jgi:hypothetical protein